MSDTTITATEAGRLLGMHRTEVSRRAQPGGVLETAVVTPPRGRRAARFSRKAIEVYAAALREQRPLDPQLERARKDRAAANLAELRLQVERSKFLPRDEVERQWTAEVTAVKNKLLAWSTILADQLHRAAGRDGVAGMEILLQSAVYEVLDELAGPERPIECPHCRADLSAADEQDRLLCGAPTKAGTACRKPAGEDGRCHQHRRDR